MGLRQGRVCYSVDASSGLRRGEGVLFLHYGSDMRESVVRRNDFSEVTVPTLSLSSGASVLESAEGAHITPAVRLDEAVEIDTEYVEALEESLSNIIAFLEENGLDADDIDPMLTEGVRSFLTKLTRGSEGAATRELRLAHEARKAGGKVAKTASDPDALRRAALKKQKITTAGVDY